MSGLLSIAAGLLTLAAVALVPWFEGGFYLREQWLTAAAVTVSLVFLLVAGRGRVGGGMASIVLLAVAGLGVWQWWSGSSSDGAASREAAAQLCAAAAAVTIGATLFRRADAARVLLWAVAASSTAVGLYGMWSVSRGDQTLFGRELEVLAAPFGPMVNPNNAAAVLGLGLISAAVLLSARLVPARETHEDRPLMKSSIPAVTLGLMTVALVASLMTTGSRSGLASGFIGAAVAALLARPRQTQGSAVLVIACGAAAIYAATRLTDATWIAEVWEQADQLAEDARFSHWQNMSEAVRERPLTGWGFGSYGQVSRKFEPSVRRIWYEHADSQWVEAAVEGGLPAVALGGALVLVVLSGGRRRLGDRAAKLPAAAAIGAVTTIALHSLFDFAVLLAGVWLPAALLVGCGSQRRPSVAWLPLALVVAAGGAWATWELRLAAGVQQTALAVPSLTGRYSANPTRTRLLLDHAEAALAARPDDALGYWTVARLREHEARLSLMDEPPPVLATRAPILLWSMTSPETLHGLCCSLSPSERDELREAAAVSGPMTAALTASKRAAELSPLRFRPLQHVAALSWIDDDPFDTSAAATAADRLPRHAATQLTANRVAWSAGDVELLTRTTRRLLSLTDEHDGELIPRLTREFSVQEIAEDFVPKDASVLARVAAGQTRRPGDPLRQALISRAVELNERQADADRRAVAAAAVARLRGDDAAAEETLRTQLGNEPSSARSRRALAELLAESGRHREAIIEAKAAIASDRRTPADQRLIRRMQAVLANDAT